LFSKFSFFEGVCSLEQSKATCFGNNEHFWPKRNSKEGPKNFEDMFLENRPIPKQQTQIL
jgi:hypothetical protein